MRDVVVVLALLAACGDRASQAPADAEPVIDAAGDAGAPDAPSGTAFTAAPTAVTFNTAVSTTVRDTVVFANTAGAASGPVTLTLGGANASLFVVESSTCTGTLGPAATCTVSVAFTPTAAGTFAAMLTLTDGASTVTVALSGFGTTATGLTVSPALKDFGTAGVGTTSSYASFTVKNVGTVATGALALVFDTGATGDYVLANNLCAGAMVAPQATCSFSLGFRPTAVGTRTATLKATDPVSSAQVGIAVTGIGAIVSGIVFTPSTYDFGTVTVGDSAFAHQFTLTNTGGVATGAIATGTSGTNVGDFLKMADNCNGQTLGPGAACTLFIAFEPGAAGARSAHVTAVASPGGSASSDLSGAGQ